MTQTIENPVDCDMFTGVCLLNSRVIKAAETHQQISDVYGENDMRNEMVRNLCRALFDQANA
ncbi:hypothetical protein CEXT_191701, partial [Caerostris extrusa]